MRNPSNSWFYGMNPDKHKREEEIEDARGLLGHSFSDSSVFLLKTYTPCHEKHYTKIYYTCYLCLHFADHWCIEWPGHDVQTEFVKCIHPLAFFYKLHTEILPVKTWLKKKVIFVSSVKCRLCDVTETIQCCFISSKSATLFWDVFQQTKERPWNQSS